MNTEFFDIDYIKFYSPYISEEVTNKEIEFITDFLPKGSKVLDICCGHGRHSISLAQKGYPVIGIDKNENALQIAKNNSEELEENSSTQFLNQDVLKEFDFDINVALLIGNSLGIFRDKGKELLQNIYKGLPEGGKLILEVNNRDFNLKYWSPIYWDESEGIRLLQRRTFDIFNDEVTYEDIRIYDGVEKEYSFTLKTYSLHELINLLNLTGFKNIEAYDGFSLNPPSMKSSKFVLIAHKI
ncbi:class I SAM-dependent methyltransferase [Bacillus thuringiensis]|uniref:class I SAM-dependent methyltransferase n=1 Tax=Bacillus thuringiensis TaxID=1428 RepID=UPI000BF77A62|nr:class I SAM-dependent methyltransferase [Bacillus thuringiensis]PFI41169.1 hypothetical protein COI77_03955 [Bacillus thuringiensis]